MLSISVEFLHGTFRGDPEGTANTGHQERGEWPPSPSRLFAAFVAADGTGEYCRMTDGSELHWFECLPPPFIHAVSSPHHQRIQDRYVAKYEKTASKYPWIQEYVGKTGTLVRPGVRVVPRDPRVMYRWKEEPTGEVLYALQLRAARIGYLGSSDSPVRVRVQTGKQESAPVDCFIPDEKGDHFISVAQQGTLEILDRVHEQWQEQGASISRSRYPALRHPVSYRSPLKPKAVDHGEVVAWLSLGKAVSGRRITRLTKLFKDAVLSKYQDLYGEPPPVLHGHGYDDERGYELARFLALPDVGGRYSRGLIHGLALWLPPDTKPDIRRRTRDAAQAVARLAGNELNVTVAVRSGADKIWARNPGRWLGPSRHWITAIPAIHERRGRLDLEAVANWCHHAGLPEPIDFRSSRTPLIPGALDLAPVEVNRPETDKPRLPYSHVELLFPEPVSGPVVIGSGRQRGFGLCVPVRER